MVNILTGIHPHTLYNYIVIILSFTNQIIQMVYKGEQVNFEPCK